MSASDDATALTGIWKNGQVTRCVELRFKLGRVSPRVAREHLSIFGCDLVPVLFDLTNRDLDLMRT